MCFNWLWSPVQGHLWSAVINQSTCKLPSPAFSCSVGNVWGIRWHPWQWRNCPYAPVRCHCPPFAATPLSTFLCCGIACPCSSSILSHHPWHPTACSLHGITRFACFDFPGHFVFCWGHFLIRLIAFPLHFQLDSVVSAQIAAFPPSRMNQSKQARPTKLPSLDLYDSQSNLISLLKLKKPFALLMMEPHSFYCILIAKNVQNPVLFAAHCSSNHFSSCQTHLARKTHCIAN